MRLVGVKCPECGARMGAPPDRDVVRCDFCGAESRVQRRTVVQQAPAPAPHRDPRWDALPVATEVRSRGRWLVAVWIGVVLVISLIGFAVQRAQVQSTQAKLSRLWVGWGTIAVHDANGDGVADVIGPVIDAGSGDSAGRLVAVDGAGGGDLWASEPVATDTNIQFAVFGDTIVVASDDAKTVGLDARTGKRRWASALPEKLGQFCTGDADGVIAETADDKRYRVAAADGAVAPAADGDCVAPAGNGRQSAGPGVAVAWRPGDTPAFDGLYPDRVLHLRGQPIVVVTGYRTPGSQVPMLGAYHAETRAVLWKTDVPPSEPLAFASSAPEHVAVGRAAVAVTYNDSDWKRVRVAAFSLADGRRLWDVPVLVDSTSSIRAGGIGLAPDRVFTNTSNQIDAFALADGAHLFTRR